MLNSKLIFCRILTPALKALTAKASISGLQECIESIGGVGYLENEESQHINVARLYRDANVLSIWEGTTNVLGTDFVKILKGRDGEKTLKALERWINQALFRSSSERTLVTSMRKVALPETCSLLDQRSRRRALTASVRARELMDTFAILIIGTLMIVDAERDGEYC